MMKIKPEGEQFRGEAWAPKHPARWCVLKYLWVVVMHGHLSGAPCGQMWEHDGHCWTCYMRFRLYSMGWRFALRHPLSLWQHTHRDFRDIFAMGNLVNGAEDPFLGAKYQISIHTRDGEIKPWPTREPAQ